VGFNSGNFITAFQHVNLWATEATDLLENVMNMDIDVFFIIKSVNKLYRLPKCCRYLAEYGKHMKTLRIRECHQVSEHVLSQLRSRGVKIDRLPPPSTDRRMDRLVSRYKQKLHLQI